MSLGLFTKDANGDVWFDIDCLAHPHPKHFVFNLNADPNEGRVLVLYTRYTFDPTEVGMDLIKQSQPVQPGDFRQKLEEHLNNHVRTWQDHPERSGFLRVVYQFEGQWVFDEVVWSASNLPGQQAQSSVNVTTAAVPMQFNTLYCIGEGERYAQIDWLATFDLPIEDRLRSALQAAYDNGALVQIPSVRRPAKLSDRILSYAEENQLITLPL